jgi:isoleucyl-tRNA synthetase
LDPTFIDQVEAVKPLILSEVNVKEIEYITDTEGFITKKAKANFKTLGKLLGRHMKVGAQMIAEFDQDTISNLEKTNSHILDIDGDRFMLSTDDVEISFDEIPGWQVAVDREITVALDITLTDDLIAEGIARELVNRIQNIRKASNFNVTDRITIHIEDHELIQPAVEKFGEYIKNEVLGDAITLNGNVSGESVEITESLSLKIAVTKV